MSFLTGIHEDRGGILHIDDVNVVKLAGEVGTPVYVTSLSRIRQNYRRLYHAFTSHYDKVRIYYSMKANSNISVLKSLLDEGAFLDALSPGEIYLGLEAGFPASRIMYTGTSVGRRELKYAVEKGVTINADSPSELSSLLEISQPQVISIRINPEVGSGHHEHVITGGRQSKFGVWKTDAVEAYAKAKDHGIERFGIHMHIGSGILDPSPYLTALEKFLEIAGEIQSTVKIEFEFIDIGGGFGVPYKPGEPELNIDDFAQKITEQIKNKYPGDTRPLLCIEPGRYIVCDSTILLTQINMVKKTPYKVFIGVDAGFNTLIRPAMYGSYHHMVIANKLDRPPVEKYDVVGPLCESGDVLGRERMLPEAEEGDLVAVFNAGAYGFSMSSQYNSWPRPAEILVNEGVFEVIRDRESLQDLKRGQRIAKWLK